MTNVSASVLLIDDSTEDRYALRRHLERKPGVIFRCYDAQTAAEGLEQSRLLHPDAILVDYNLPDETGLTFLSEIVAEHGLHTIAVIILTGSGSEDIAVEAMKRGAQDYVVKNVQIGTHLKQTVTNAIEKARLQRQIEEQRHDLEARNQRLRFLSDASTTLATSLNFQVTLDHVAHLSVPYLGDACIIDLTDEKNQRRTISAAHVDSALDATLRDMRQAYPPAWNDAHPARQVLRTGQPLVVNTIPNDMIKEVAHNDEHRTLLNMLNINAFLMVPFVVRGQTIGVISLYAMHTPRRYTNDDLEVIEELARRAAMALDNAQLYAEAQEAVRERDAFISIASHEIKNPLTSLLGRAELLQRRLRAKPNTEREQNDVQTMIDQSKRINTLLTDMLDLSRLASEQLTGMRAPVDLKALLQSVIAEAQEATSAHKIELHDAETVVTLGDASRLKQVFQNLINNAVKYSPAGGAIHITVDKQNEQARITIRDEGMGIPAEALPHLFKRFYRVSQNSQQISGSGIGLYVVKEIVTNHGGTIEVESTEGQGSTFTVLLPLE